MKISAADLATFRAVVTHNALDAAEIELCRMHTAEIRRALEPRTTRWRGRFRQFRICASGLNSVALGQPLRRRINLKNDD